MINAGSTYDEILGRMLNAVKTNVDKREGSIIYDALAPAAAELAQAYIELAANRDLTFISTSYGEWLDKRAFEHGIVRYAETAATYNAIFFDNNGNQTEVPNGTRFLLNNIELIASSNGTVTTTKKGSEANGLMFDSDMLPLDFVDGLKSAKITDLLIPASARETDEELFARFERSALRPAFSGNRGDYERIFKGIDGVGAVKLYRVSESSPNITAIFVGADFLPPVPEFIRNVQEIIDPLENSGEGLGCASIAHVVKVSGVQAVGISVETELALANDVTLEQVSPFVNDAIENYLAVLRRTWGTLTAPGSIEYLPIIVRKSLIEAAILSANGVIDVANTIINGSDENIVLSDEFVPVLEGVSLNGENSINGLFA